MAISRLLVIDDWQKVLFWRIISAATDGKVLALRAWGGHIGSPMSAKSINKLGMDRRSSYNSYSILNGNKISIILGRNSNEKV